MTHLIDKDALVAEIERRIKAIEKIKLNDIAGRDELIYIKGFINTLEVKEVDFDAEWERYFEHRGEMATVNVKHLAKHFFELGINASNPLTWEDVRELHIIFESLDVDIELSRSKLQKETLGYYEEVLKRFKAQKGEKV